MCPDLSLRLRQSLGEDDTRLMTPDDANPELPMAAFATLQERHSLKIDKANPEANKTKR